MRTEEDELRDDARAATLLQGLPAPSPASCQRGRETPCARLDAAPAIASHFTA